MISFAYQFAELDCPANSPECDNGNDSPGNVAGYGTGRRGSLKDKVRRSQRGTKRKDPVAVRNLLQRIICRGGFQQADEYCEGPMTGTELAKIYVVSHPAMYRYLDALDVHIEVKE